MDIVFWQRMFSPHMMGLAEAVAARGHCVTFVATEQLSKARREQGWQVALERLVKRRIINEPAEAEAFIRGLRTSTVHITQGLRGNAEIRTYQRQIVANGQRLWVIMESVDPGGWRAPLKNAIYQWEIRRRSKHIDGILAIGAGTADWLYARGFSGDRIFPFAYFITQPELCHTRISSAQGSPFTFAFIGNLEPWKNPMLALDAFNMMSTDRSRLIFVGDGSLRAKLELRAREILPAGKIEFFGRLPMSDIPQVLSQVDCLLLPSNVDGWGVVASEAMLMGTPTIVSNACGVRSAVQAAPEGTVFPACDLLALQNAMSRIQTAGRSQDKRAALKRWATSLGADFGARYLEQILSGSQNILTPEWLWRKALKQ